MAARRNTHVAYTLLEVRLQVRLRRGLSSVWSVRNAYVAYTLSEVGFRMGVSRSLLSVVSFLVPLTRGRDKCRVWSLFETLVWNSPATVDVQL